MNSKDINPRLLTHIGLAVFSLIIYIVVNLVSHEAIFDQLSIVTAYICLLLMACALSVGPLRLYIHKAANPINIYLRRDIGIWAAVFGLVHLFLATSSSMTSEYIQRYVDVATQGLSESARSGLFLWGSVTAFVAGLLLLLLLCLSNDTLLRLLGMRWWKRLQRLAYLAFALTLAHGVMFQILESRGLVLVGLLLIVALTVLALQLFGMMSATKYRLTKKE